VGEHGEEPGAWATICESRLPEVLLFRADKVHHSQHDRHRLRAYILLTINFISLNHCYEAFHSRMILPCPIVDEPRMRKATDSLSPTSINQSVLDHPARDGLTASW
jgi:hypothetical protein